MPLSPAIIRSIATQRGSIQLRHGTDLRSARAIAANGVRSSAAKALAGSGDSWVTDDFAWAECFARVNPAGGKAAILEFEVPGAVLLSLLPGSPPEARYHVGDGLEIFSSGFATLNSAIANASILVLP